MPYENKTTRRFKHCEEAWRVLVGAKVMFFIESTKLFERKLFFDVDFISFLKVRHKVNGSRGLFESQSYSILCEYTPDKTEKMLSGVKV